MFTAPYQVVSANADPSQEEGWGLFFHPDLLHRTALAKKINGYSFFHYSSTEALHISEEEKKVLEMCIKNIEQEYARYIDKHTQSLMVNNIELLLNYCDRFYDRQFFTRENINHDIVQRFDELISAYFTRETLIESGLPDVKYFSARLNLSTYYLSDVLKKYTGKTTLEYIHLKLIEKAKGLLSGSGKSISEIAYELGFEHPSHFTKIFKAKTGISPKSFRNLN